jgi:hypothetical protein
MAILTLAQECHNLIDSEKYMQQFTLGACPEACSFLEESEIEGLVDNSDYNILIPLDSKTDDASRDAQVRRNELSYRLRTFQCVLKLLFSVIQKNSVAAVENRDSLLRVRADAERTDEAVNIKWSQRIRTGSGVEFEGCIFQVLILAVDLWVKYREPTGSISEDYLRSVEVQFTECTHMLAEFLCLTPTSESARYLSTSTEEALAASTSDLAIGGGALEKGGSVHKKSSVSSSWLQRMSYFTLTVGTWVPIVIGSILSDAPSTKKTKEKKKGKAGAATAESAASESPEGPKDIYLSARNSSTAFVQLLRKGCEVLKSVESQGVKHVAAHVDTMLSEVGFTQFDGRSNCDSMNKTRKDLIGKIVASYSTSCSNIFGVLNMKLAAIAV